MIILKELYEEFNENRKDYNAFDLFLTEATSDYFYKRQPIDIPAMAKAGKIVKQYEPTDEQAFDNEVDANYVCDYEFAFEARSAIANRTLVLPADSVGDMCSIVLVEKSGQSNWKNNFAMMKFTSTGKFVRGWKFDAVLDQILTVWVYGTQYNKNPEMSPDFLIKTFGGRNITQPDNRITITVNEQLYSGSAVINLITNDIRYRHLHADHPERCEKLGKIIRSQRGFVGNPVIVAEPY